MSTNHLTNALRRAHVIGTWEQRYRERTLPEADSHAAAFMVRHDSNPDLLADQVEAYIKTFLLKAPPPRTNHP